MNNNRRLWVEKYKLDSTICVIFIEDKVTSLKFDNAKVQYRKLDRDAATPTNNNSLFQIIPHFNLKLKGRREDYNCGQCEYKSQNVLIRETYKKIYIKKLYVNLYKYYTPFKKSVLF